MAYQLGDVFIGDFPVTQSFGMNPQNYSQFMVGNPPRPMQGHNGIDFGCPKGTQIVAANDGTVIQVAYDANGFGNYIVVHHGTYATLYGHLDKQLVPNGVTVVRGQLIGFSGNTGNVYPRPTSIDPNAGSHLHFGVSPRDAIGNKTEPNNGFAGYIDPNSDRCAWQIKELKSPVSNYVQGGWYDNPATGQNQRWFDGAFLPVGQTDPLSTPTPVVTPPVVVSQPAPTTVVDPVGVGGVQVDDKDKTISNLNNQLDDLKSKLILAQSQASTEKTRADGLQVRSEALQTEVTQFTEKYNEEHQLRLQAENSRDVCLQAQANQNRKLTMYSKTSMLTQNWTTLLRQSIINLLNRNTKQTPKGGGEKKDGTDNIPTSDSNT